MSHSQQAQVSQEAVAGMMEMTQCTAQQAQFMLEASMGDMHRAIAMYYGEAGPVKAALFSYKQCFQMLGFSGMLCLHVSHTAVRRCVQHVAEQSASDGHKLYCRGVAACCIPTHSVRPHACGSYTTKAAGTAPRSAPRR